MHRGGPKSHGGLIRKKIRQHPSIPPVAGLNGLNWPNPTMLGACTPNNLNGNPIQ
jgi:hypothetical protein